MTNIVDTDVYLIQVGLKSLGFDPGQLDGDKGPNTKAALNAWLLSQTVSKTIAELIVHNAKKQVGIRETSKNQGPGLDKFWTATSYADGYKNREPYCAAFVCWVIRESIGSSNVLYDPPVSPVAYDIERWAKANTKNGVKLLSNEKQLKPGDIFTLAAVSHIGIIVGVNKSTVITIEGNTNAAGSREGDGVYERTRTIASLRKIVRLA